MRNPLLQSLEKPNASQLLEDVKAGKVDPQEKVLSMLKENPTLRSNLQNAMPMLAALAKQAGISDAEISAFKTAANLR
jgi:hypothetical protein